MIIRGADVGAVQSPEESPRRKAVEFRFTVWICPPHKTSCDGRQELGAREGHALLPSGGHLNAANILLHTEDATHSAAAIKVGQNL